MPCYQDVLDVVRETCEEWILEIMREHRWLSENGLLRRMAKKHPEADKEDARDAMFRLIYDKKIEFTRRHNLRMI